jgi:hypothetical protein
MFLKNKKQVTLSCLLRCREQERLIFELVLMSGISYKTIKNNKKLIEDVEEEAEEEESTS